MPPLPKKKHSRARKGGKASHHGLKLHSLSECPQCHAAKYPHRVCHNCGFYDGREVIVKKTPIT